jgi:hypothetical protein
MPGVTAAVEKRYPRYPSRSLTVVGRPILVNAFGEALERGIGKEKIVRYFKKCYRTGTKSDF